MNEMKGGSFLLLNADCRSIFFASHYFQKSYTIGQFCLFYTPGNSVVVENGEVEDKSRYGSVIRIVINEEYLDLDPGALAIGPLYYYQRKSEIEAVSSDPALLAAIFDTKLDKQALFEDLFIGFRIGGRSIFEGISKIESRQKLRVTKNGISTISQKKALLSVADAEEQLIETLSADIAASLDNGFALELTGGIDSRLILALGLYGGARPQLSFTLGPNDSNDVVVARKLINRTEGEFLNIADSYEQQYVVQDTKDFVSSSGFCSNAYAYGWLPSVYRLLENDRCGQLSGVGGEMAGDFYFTPFDRFVKNDWSYEKWFQYRLLKNRKSLRLVEAFDKGGQRYKQLFHDVKALVVMDTEESWRHSLVDLYSKQRLRQWAGPVINASSEWYLAQVPFFDQAYIDWSESLGNDARRHRNPQKQLSGKLAPELKVVPYADEMNRGLIRGHYLTTIAKKIYQRIKGQQKNDMGTISLQNFLELDVSLKDKIQNIHSQIFKNESNDSSHYPLTTEQRGFLLTAAFAVDKKEEYKGNILHHGVTKNECE